MEMDEGIRIARDLLNALRPRAEALHRLQPKKEFTAWTLAVKAILEQLADKKYECLYSGKELHEFLVDFTWWDAKSKRTVLACECEFGNPRDVARNPERIGEDFDKLLSVKADLKLMVFDSYASNKEETQVETVLNNLSDRFRNFGQHLDGEVYILLDTWRLGDVPTARLWQCVIKQNGPDKSLHFFEVDTN
jgi:hypothetical protein